MKFILLSDIHGNDKALDECLKYLEENNIDSIIWCGDYITDFPGGHNVIEKIKFYETKYKSYIIKGNRDIKVLDFARGKEFDIKQKGNIEYTYNILPKEDLKWIESLPEIIRIELENGKKIFVSHDMMDDDGNDCDYKIFGHTHHQGDFIKDNIKYINPGSVGVVIDGTPGAQFTILEITDEIEKIEHHTLKYDYDELIQDIRKTPIYNDDIKWGKLLEKSVITGEDYPFYCVREYLRLKIERNLVEDSAPLWNEVLEKLLN